MNNADDKIHNLTSVITNNKKDTEKYSASIEENKQVTSKHAERLDLVDKK